MHHLLHMKARRRNRSRSLRVHRMFFAWTMLLAILALPASATTKYVCSKGMAEAGPACPRCHGHESQDSDQATDSPCCRVVINAAPTATAPPSILTAEASHTSAVALVPTIQLQNDPRVAAVTADSPQRLRPFLQTSPTILRL